MLKILLFSHFLSRSLSLGSFFLVQATLNCCRVHFPYRFFPSSLLFSKVYVYVCGFFYSLKSRFFFLSFWWQFFSLVRLSFIADNCKHCTFPHQMTSYHQLSLFCYFLSEFYGRFITIHPDISLGNVRSIFHGHKLIDFILFVGNFFTVCAARYQWRKRP